VTQFPAIVAKRRDTRIGDFDLLSSDGQRIRNVFRENDVY